MGKFFRFFDFWFDGMWFVGLGVLERIVILWCFRVGSYEILVI